MSNSYQLRTMNDKPMYPVTSKEAVIGYGEKDTLNRFIRYEEVPAVKLEWSAAQASASAAFTTIPLGATAASVPYERKLPAARSLNLKANVSGVTGNVVVHGLSQKNGEISETFAIGGTSEKQGNLAFDSIVSVDLPVQVHTPVRQSISKKVLTGAVTTAGDITVTLTSALLDSPVAVVVTLEENDTVAVVAEKISDAIMLDPDLDAVAKGIAASVIGDDLDTVKVEVLEDANDSTLALAFADTDLTGVTMDADSVVASGVPKDIITISTGNKLGIALELSAKAYIEKTWLADVVESTPPTLAYDVNKVEKNTLLLNSALNGSAVTALLYVV